MTLSTAIENGSVTRVSVIHYELTFGLFVAVIHWIHNLGICYFGRAHDDGCHGVLSPLRPSPLGRVHE